MESMSMAEIWAAIVAKKREQDELRALCGGPVKWYHLKSRPREEWLSFSDGSLLEERQLKTFRGQEAYDLKQNFDIEVALHSGRAYDMPKAEN
jgi:hypothetical protein